MSNKINIMQLNIKSLNSTDIDRFSSDNGPGVTDLTIMELKTTMQLYGPNFVNLPLTTQQLICQTL